MEQEKETIAAIYCKKCFRRFGVNKKTKNLPVECPDCHENLTDQALTSDEKTQLIQALHKRENHFRDLNDRAMSCVVLGAIFIIIGLIFLSLSFKLDLTNPSDNVRHLTIDAFEFWVFVFSLGGGGAAFLYGLGLLVFEIRQLRVLKHDIASIQERNSIVVSETGLWFPEFVNHAEIIAKNRRAIRAAKKARALAEKGKASDGPTNPQ